MHFANDGPVLAAAAAASDALPLPSETAVLRFSRRQADTIARRADAIALAGGPQARCTGKMAAHYAAEIAATMSPQQCDSAQRFANDELSLLLFKGLLNTVAGDPPDELPELNALENDQDCLRLASRSQLLLHLIGQRAFSYDIDNDGKIIRFVGNFKGGAKTTRKNETPHDAVERSSHSGLSLGAHTEAPYHCSIKSSGTHSPAPSTLILTARWNPLNEATTVIPMHDVITRLGAHHALALTSKTFDFSRSDSFRAGKGADGRHVSILDLNTSGRFVIRYNAYRFSLSENAPESARVALARLRDAIARSQTVQCVLQPDVAVAINNGRALHCRDQIADNRRLLLRLFAYSRDAEPLVLSDDPLLVQG